MANGRQFVNIQEYNDLEQRVTTIEKHLGLKSQSKSAPFFDDPPQPMEIYMEQDLFTDHVDTFHMNSLPKYPDLSTGKVDRITVFIRIHLHNQEISKPKGNLELSKNFSSEQVEIIEYVRSYFSIFVYKVGGPYVKADGRGNSSVHLVNSTNNEESIYLEYKSKESELNDSKGNITIIINNDKITNYDREKFINLINIGEGKIGVYAKKNFKDFRFELAPSKKLNIPSLKLINQEYIPKMKILIEDKIFQSTDPLPKDIEKQINYETIFVRIYKQFDEKSFKSIEGLSMISIKLNENTTIMVLSKVDFSSEKVTDIGYRLIRNSYYKDREKYLYFFHKSPPQASTSLHMVFIISTDTKFRTDMKGIFATSKQLFKTNFDFYINNQFERYFALKPI